jgi:hypothetical protein
MIFGKKLYIKGMELKQNKNRRMISLIAPLAIGFSLCACGSDNVAGGGPSGTEAGNAITAQILIANAPAAHARVKLVEHNSLDGQGYTATTNDSGIVTIEKVAIGNYTMEAIVDDSALSLQLPVNVKDTVNDIDLGTQSLQKSVYIGGSIADFIDDSSSESLKNMNGFVKFRGLDHSAAITNGKFKIFGLPAGQLNMVFIPESVTDTVKISVETDAGDSITTLKPKAPEPENETLLIEDFEDGDIYHRLAPEYTFFGIGGLWQINTVPFDINNEKSDSSFKITPVASYNMFESPFTAIIQDDGNGGKEVHFTIEFPDTSVNKQASAIMKMDIGNSNVSYNLSSVDSIAFDAWGKGSVYFVIIDGTQTEVDQSLGVAAYTIGKVLIELTQEKKKYKLALADILPNEEKRKSVTTIGISFRYNAEIYFDNLEFIGKDLLNIWKTKE